MYITLSATNSLRNRRVFFSDRFFRPAGYGLKETMARSRVDDDLEARSFRQNRISDRAPSATYKDFADILASLSRIHPPQHQDRDMKSSPLWR